MSVSVSGITAMKEKWGGEEKKKIFFLVKYHQRQLQAVKLRGTSESNDTQLNHLSEQSTTFAKC